MGKLKRVTSSTTRHVTLPDSGLVVIIRKIKPEAAMFSMIESLTAKSAQVLVGMKNADLGAKLGAAMSKTPDRGTSLPDPTDEWAAGMSEEDQAAMLEVKALQDSMEAIKLIKSLPGQLVDQSFVGIIQDGEQVEGATVDDMIEAYQGSRELHDFGMGTDFDVLMSGIEQHSGATAASVEGVVKSERFLETVGNIV